MSHSHQGGDNNMEEDDPAEFVKEYGLSEMFLYDKVLKPSDDPEKVIQEHNVVAGGAVSTMATVVSTEVEAKTELVVQLESGAIDNIGVDQQEEPQPTKQKGQARRRDDEPQEILRKRARASIVRYNAAQGGKGKKRMGKEAANKRKNRLRLDIPNFKIKKQVKQVMSSPSYAGGENSNNVINNHPDGDYTPVAIPAGESVLDPIGVAPDPQDLEMIENMMYFMNTSPQPFYNPVDSNHEYYSLMSTYLAAPSHQGPFGTMDSHVSFVESQPLPPPPLMAFSAEPSPPLSPPLPPPALLGDEF